MRLLALAGAVLILTVTAAAAAPQTYRSSAGNLAVETFASGLVHPWALAFLPDGRMLVTERTGRIRIVAKDGKLSPALTGVPKVYARSQMGPARPHHRPQLQRQPDDLFLLQRRQRRQCRIGARAHLADGGTPALDNVKPIFKQQGPQSSSGNNVGCRIAQSPDGNFLFLSLGDHFNPRDEAQNLANDIGKIVRIKPDGSVPPDNPFVDRKGAKPEIWSYGNRNPQGLAFHPQTDELWEHEHGPRGGDEVNIIEPGKNYGWPVIGYGIDYNGAKIHESTRKAGMEQPLNYWVPSIAPSGMAFYTGDLFAPWRGNLFVGALAGEMLVRLEVDGDKVGDEERLLQDLHERIRDVRQGPDGALWLLTDSPAGRLLRVTPGTQ